MADRFLFKKFASETNDVGQFGSFQSTGGNIGDGVKTTDPDLIQSLPAWEAGWGNAVDYGLLLPRLEEMNGVQRVFAEMLWNQWRDGMTFWQAGAPVKALQSIVMYQTGDELPKLYLNKTGVNGTNPPPQDTDNWGLLDDVFTTKADLESPSFAGTPTAPTPASGASAQQIATVGFVQSSVSSYETPIVPITETQGEITLLTNTMYKMTISGATTFVLPASPNADVYNQIKILANVTVAQADLINFGTNGNYFNRTATDTSEIGSYDIYLDYDPNLSSWVAGVLAKGTE